METDLCVDQAFLTPKKDRVKTQTNESIQRRASRIALGQKRREMSYMKKDANYWAGARLSVEENTFL